MGLPDTASTLIADDNTNSNTSVVEFTINDIKHVIDFNKEYNIHNSAQSLHGHSNGVKRSVVTNTPITPYTWTLEKDLFKLQPL